MSTSWWCDKSGDDYMTTIYKNPKYFQLMNQPQLYSTQLHYAPMFKSQAVTLVLSEQMNVDV